MMFLFDLRRFPAQVVKPASLSRSNDLSQTRDATDSGSKERLVSTVLLLCMLAAGLYGEILRYAF
jgi:hypothetical protein